MKNKKVIYLATLIVITAAFVVAWFVMKSVNNAKSNTENEETETSVLIRPEVEKEDVVAIEYTNENGTFSFERNSDGDWVYNSDENFPLNQTKPNSMATTLASLEASREIVDGDEDSFGFDNPTVTVKATYSDGSEINALIGDSNDFYDGKYYFKDVDSGKIYLVSSSVEVSFEATEKSLISADVFPTDIDADSATSATVRDEVGVQNTFDDEELLTDFLDLFNALSFSADRALYTGEKGPEEYGITEDCAKATVSYKKEVEVDGDDGDTDIVYTDEVYEILFGNSFTNSEGGTSYYYSIPGSTLVYTMTSDSYENIMSYTSKTADTTSDE